MNYFIYTSHHTTVVIQLTLTLKMTTPQVVERPVTVNNSPIQHYAHPDNHASLTYEMTPESNLSQFKGHVCT